MANDRVLFEAAAFGPSKVLAQRDPQPRSEDLRLISFDELTSNLLAHAIGSICEDNQ
jgi:hypothetical protein